ncbi:MAG TPA: hypothetical protein VM577_19365 [Anaerovoracaceae bacterium]|nr:hypothetical protein [Anaerovoracaceae bacterium]
MNWFEFAGKVPLVVSGLMNIVHKVQGAEKGAKVQAVVDAVPDSIALVEFAAGKDVFNDPEIANLLKAVAEAEHAVAEARAALKAGILNKSK